MRAMIAVVFILSTASLHAFTSHWDGDGNRNQQRRWASQYPRTIGVTFGGGFDSNASVRLGHRSNPPRAPRSWSRSHKSPPASSTASWACRSVQQRVTYRADTSSADEWRSGEETMATGWGDCEDIAAAVKRECGAKGVDSDIYIVRARALQAAHAVTIGGPPGRMWMSSNGDYRNIRSIEAARQAIARDFRWKGVEVTIRKYTSK